MTDSTLFSRALQGSVLVVAHPDDEVLWFGSIAPKVDKIVICFLNDPVKPELAEARRRTLHAHPWKDKIVCLGLDETNSFNSADWTRPETTDYGLRIIKSRKISTAYRRCYRQLRKMLAPIIQNASNVFTHNPWGEYGHEEHVLVHRATTSLTGAMKKRVWYGNYASNWSEGLMRLYLDRSVQQIIRGKIDAAALEEIADVYRANDAWTWCDEYKGLGDEFFVQGPLTQTNRPGFGWMFPINLLCLPDREKVVVAKANSPLRRAFRKLIGYSTA